MTAPHSDAARQAAIEDYRTSGDTIADVAKRHGMGKNALATDLRAAGATRRRGPIVNRGSRHSALADHRNGMAINAIAKKYRLTRHTVTTWIAEEAADDPNELAGGQWVRTGLTWHYHYTNQENTNAA